MTLLHEFDVPRKLLVTMFLLVLSCGFFVAHLYLHNTMAAVSGEEKFMPSMQDITLHFHGDATKTRLKSMVLGPMKRYFMENSDNEPVELKPDEQADLDAVLAWNNKGAPLDGYWNREEKEKTKDPQKIFSVLDKRGCFVCHASDATGTEAKPDSPLNTFKGISRYTKGDVGMSKGRLLMLSHVHLLGMALMFLGAGAALVLSRWPGWFRGALVVGGFISILADIFGWWAVKYGGGDWAWTVIFGGMLMGVSFGFTVLAVLWDMWGRGKAKA